MKMSICIVMVVAVLAMVSGAYAQTAFVFEDGSRYRARSEGYLEKVDGATFSESQEQYAVVQRYVIDDFNVRRALSRDHATIAPWTLNPSDDTQQCRFSYEAHDLYGKQYGQSIKVRYDVESRGRAVNGFFLKIMNVDITLFHYLSFWIKGDDYYGYTNTMKIGLKNERGDAIEYPLAGISGEWQNYIIDLSEIRDTLQWRTIGEVYTIFESDNATKLKGVLYIDQFEYLTVAS